MNLLFVDVGEEDVTTPGENCPGEKFIARIMMSQVLTLILMKKIKN